MHLNMYYTAPLRNAVASHSPVETKLSFHRAPQLSGEEFLLFLGSRVRDLRNRRGMTRKTLAHGSGVSERHLAQLESGEGNISILLLRRIATVLSISLEELFAPNKQDAQQNNEQNSSQTQTIFRFLERLPSHRLAEAANRLMRDFGPEQNLRLSHVPLIGLCGAGTSTHGSKLAAELKISFVRLDHQLEKETRMPFPEIFYHYGHYRDRPTQQLVL